MGSPWNNSHRDKQDVFLKAFHKCGSVCKACRMVGIPYRALRYWLKESAEKVDNLDASFREKFYEEKKEWVERLEREADRRAIEGIARIRTYQGKACMVPKDPDDPNSELVVQVDRECSDVLLMFRLKALAPEKYRENRTIEHKGGEKVTVEVVYKPLAAAGRFVESTAINPIESVTEPNRTNRLLENADTED